MIGDASVELGRYRQGFDAFARLGELRPGLVAYARLSYSRELQGDVEGATRLMREAVDAGSGAPENTQWTRVQLAALLLKSGHVEAAAREYRHALALLPGYARAEAGLGAVAVARGDLAEAEKWYDRAASHLPLPDIVAQLGDVRAARGEAAGAKEAYALVRVEQALFVRAGGNADLETALFEASHPGARSRASVVALARKALAFRPSIYGHDSLAWALYSAGKCRQALPQAMLANRLGTIDPAALVAPRRDRGLRRKARRRARRPREGARAHAALPPARRPGGAAAAEGARMSPGRPVRPSGTRGECHLARSASSPSRPSRWPCSCRRPRRIRSATSRSTSTRAWTSLGRTSRCATCSTWPRSRRSSGGSSSMRTGTGASGRGDGARARSARRARLAASAAAGRRGAGAARARDGARRLPQGAGRALDDAARCALPRDRARARRCAAHAEALQHVRHRPRRLARAAGGPRRGCRGALDGRRDRRSARRR